MLEISQNLNKLFSPKALIILNAIRLTFTRII